MIDTDQKQEIVETHGASATGHGQTRSPDRHLHRAHRGPHRAPQGPQEGPHVPPRAAQDGGQAPPPSELRREEGHRALPRDHRQARPPQVARPRGGSQRGGRRFSSGARGLALPPVPRATRPDGTRARPRRFVRYSAPRRQRPLANPHPQGRAPHRRNPGRDARGSRPHFGRSDAGHGPERPSRTLNLRRHRRSTTCTRLQSRRPSRSAARR